MRANQRPIEDFKTFDSCLVPIASKDAVHDTVRVGVLTVIPCHSKDLFCCAPSEHVFETEGQSTIVNQDGHSSIRIVLCGSENRALRECEYDNKTIEYENRA